MRARELGAFGSSAGALAAAVALPKCPLCVAGLLSALGLGGWIASGLAPILRPTALASGLVLAAMTVGCLMTRRGGVPTWRFTRRRSRSPRCACASPSRARRP